MINLIPPKIKAQRRLVKVLSKVEWAILLLIVAVVFTAALFYSFNFSAQANLKNLEEETAELEKEVKDYKEIEGKIDQINLKLGKIDQINKERIVWSSILNELSACIPNLVTLKSINLTSGNISLAISGFAQNRREIARFKEKMESSPVFKNVYFSSSSLNEQEQDFTFSLTAELEQP